ncbi:heme exporter protein CcmD [Alcanivorax sp. 1008]|uniref:heme exporter protein CcmD n=1 Tax=Alcanivorax sp. 1008 TaxID=2816853 RepID=UPI001DF8E40D|nr:heme exporter protein CcmD [Alcanivorax sp. 1008]MCC1497106.1 heme exporter protein CcmD [Alcanivorax sp. 1008]
MYFESFAAFLQMGTHGPFVWSAYGISALLIATNMWLAYRRQRLVLNEIRRLARRDQGSL